MEYQNIINLLENTPHHPSKFRTKNWVEINDYVHRTYSTIVTLNLKIQS